MYILLVLCSSQIQTKLGTMTIGDGEPRGEECDRNNHLLVIQQIQYQNLKFSEISVEFLRRFQLAVRLRARMQLQPPCVRQ